MKVEKIGFNLGVGGVILISHALHTVDDQTYESHYYWSASEYKGEDRNKPATTSQGMDPQ